LNERIIPLKKGWRQVPSLNVQARTIWHTIIPGTVKVSSTHVEVTIDRARVLRLGWMLLISGTVFFLVTTIIGFYVSEVGGFSFLGLILLILGIGILMWHWKTDHHQ
jgi:hypothetical protein